MGEVLSSRWFVPTRSILRFRRRMGRIDNTRDGGTKTAGWSMVRSGTLKQADECRTFALVVVVDKLLLSLPGTDTVIGTGQRGVRGIPGASEPAHAPGRR